MSHYEDEAQVAELKKWWQENWMPLLAGLVLGLSGIFGWEAWQAKTTRHAEAASQMFEDLKQAASSKQDERIKELGGKLQGEFADTPYAAHAALLLAQQAAEKGEWDAAASHLDWVQKSGKDEGLQKLARLRQARVLWQQAKADEALKLLDGDAGSFGALYEELRGDIKLAQGDRAAARAAYEKALAQDVAPADREFLQRKLDDLAEPAAVANS